MCKADLWALALAWLNLEAVQDSPSWTSIIICHTFWPATPSAAYCRDSHWVSHRCNISSTLGLHVPIPLCFWRCTRQEQPFCNCRWIVLCILYGSSIQNNYIVPFAPFMEILGNEFRAVITSDIFRFAIQPDYLFVAIFAFLYNLYYYLFLYFGIKCNRVYLDLLSQNGL